MILIALAAILSPAGEIVMTQSEARLVAFAAADLRQHLPSPARDFRSVHLAPLIHQDGVTRGLLCGEVLIGDGDESGKWIEFASLETNGGYEQWLGGSMRTWCNETTARDLSRDLSETMKARLSLSR